jgi:hypothetical protein
MWPSLTNAIELVFFAIIDAVIKISHTLKMPDDVDNSFSTDIYDCFNAFEVRTPNSDF